MKKIKVKFVHGGYVSSIELTDTTTVGELRKIQGIPDNYTARGKHARGPLLDSDVVGEGGIVFFIPPVQHSGLRGISRLLFGRSS